jgi:hypothetical protein
MAEVGVGEIGDRGKEDQDREIQGVGDLYRDIKRGIIQGSFRSLHPVDNAFSVGRRSSGAAHENSGVGCDFTQRFRKVLI